MPEVTPSEFRLMLRSDLHGSARRLLGCRISISGCVARIVETEAYHQSEPGCHAFRGITPRTAVMFGEPGHAYVYFTYGNHWMLNVVAGEPGDAAAILIRAAVPEVGLNSMWQRRPKARRSEDLLNGPGKLCAAMEIGKAHNGVDLLSSDSPLKIALGDPVARVVSGTRIGLAVGKGDELPWRYADADNLEWVSRPVSGLCQLQTMA
ncbi:MAG: DNA-3-methyladenine glycosylase [Armatimonadetes bacterium]|nr:DNA-3-methyladenine glycosylase [Armatimonadota bacterium]